MATRMRWDRLRGQRRTAPRRDHPVHTSATAFRKYRGAWCVCTNLPLSEGDTVRVPKPRETVSVTLGPEVACLNGWHYFRPSSNQPPQPGPAGRQDSGGR